MLSKLTAVLDHLCSSCVSRHYRGCMPASLKPASCAAEQHALKDNCRCQQDSSGLQLLMGAQVLAPS